MLTQENRNQFVFDCSGPTVMAFVGPNGSGKSAIVEELGIRGAMPGDSRYTGKLVIDRNTGEVLIPVVNPDNIASAIARSNPNLSYEECNWQAFEQAQEIRGIYSEAMVDFAFETVGSHPSKVEFLGGLRDKGYFVAILFVGTGGPDINVSRVKHRVSLGGHDVPDDKIISRYERTMQLLPRYIEVADYIAVYDNSIDSKPGAGLGPRLLLVKRCGEIEVTPEGKVTPWLKKYSGMFIEA